MEQYTSLGILLVIVLTVTQIDAAIPYSRSQLDEMKSCYGVTDGFYVNAGSDCKSYTYCHQGVADVFRCMPGTLFNEEDNICTESALVSCDPVYKQEVMQPERQQPSTAYEDQIKAYLTMLKDQYEKENHIPHSDYQHHRPGSKSHVQSNSYEKEDQIQEDLAALKGKLEHTRQIKLDERQIKFRELRNLEDTLRNILDRQEDDQIPPK